jgi:hypothetical protein
VKRKSIGANLLNQKSNNHTILTKQAKKMNQNKIHPIRNSQK